MKVSPKVQPRVGDKRFDDRLITTIVSAIPFVHWDDVSPLLMFFWVFAIILACSGTKQKFNIGH